MVIGAGLGWSCGPGVLGHGRQKKFFSFRLWARLGPTKILCVLFQFFFKISSDLPCHSAFPVSPNS